MIGYGTLLLMSGLIFGFPWGFAPAYLGAVLGAVVFFWGARKWLGSYYKDLIVKHYPRFRAIERAIDSGGLQVN